MKPFFLLLTFCFICSGSVQAQPATTFPMQDGDAVATCFSGTNSGQNLSMPVIVVMNVRNANIYAPVGANWSYGGLRYMDNQWEAKYLGEVFGIATNNNGDIFVTATTVYGGPTTTTNYTWGIGGPGTVYKISGMTGAVSIFANLPNTSAAGKPYAALGNICYDSKHNQFFVTDLDDGKIYRLDGTSGAILSSFDPFSPDGGTPGFCPLGERLWGIGYFNDSVYFSRWNQDGGNASGSPNQIWSVGLTPSGAFVGSEHLDFNIPPLAGSGYSHPVSDIEFSQAGNMLLAERVWNGTASNPLLQTPYLGSWAHQARLLEYKNVGGTWTPFPASKYQVGTYYNKTNSSGGCDYGFEQYDSVQRAVVHCDSAVWVSGDALHYGDIIDPEIYGFQRYSQVGGNSASSAATSRFIDANNITNDVNKNSIGDIDIFKHCGVIQGQGCPPHSIVAKPLPANGMKECCYELKITDSLGGYTSLSAEVIDPLVMISGIGTTGLTGWGTSNTGMIATWTPPGGVIPTGSTNGLILCLTTLGPPPIVIFTWYGQDGTRCVDTMRFDCAKVPPPFPPCVTIDSSSIKCANTSTNGSTYSWTFTFTNNSPFSCPPYNQPAQNISIGSATMGITVTPSNQALIPPIGCAGISSPITVTISGPDAVAGAAVCIVFHLKGALVDSAGNCVWACPCDTICFTLPKCKDCCEGFKKIITTASLTQTTTTNLTILASAGPAPIVHASATIVSAEIKRNPGPQCKATAWTPVPGYFVAPMQSTWSTLPLVSPGVPTPSELMYGTVPGGASMAASSLALAMQFPPPPSSAFGCTDSLQFCIRYSFTDTNCVTCDTLICYQMRRGGFIFHSSNGIPDTLIIAVPIPVGTENGRAVVLDPDISKFGKLTMTDQSNGTLTITVPSFIAQGGPSENEMAVVGLAMKAQTGVRLISLNGTPAIDEVAQIKTVIPAGSQKSFPVVFNNFTKQNSFTCDLGIQFVVAGNPRDTLEFGERVLALTPGTKGGDVMDKDSSVSVKNVRTFALFLINGNQSKAPISSIQISVPTDQQILALGPPQDSEKTTISLGIDRTGRRHILQSGGDRISLNAGETFRPIYVTVSGGSGKTLTIGFITMDVDGNTLTQDSVTLLDPLAIVHKQDPPSMHPSAYILPPYPNPAATMTSIQVHLDNSDIVSVVVNDALGKEVGRVVTNERLNAGDNVFFFPTNELASGTYYVTLTTPGGTDTKSFKVIR